MFFIHYCWSESSAAGSCVSSSHMERLESPEVVPIMAPALAGKRVVERIQLDRYRD